MESTDSNFSTTGNLGNGFLSRFWFCLASLLLMGSMLSSCGTFSRKRVIYNTAIGIAAGFATGAIASKENKREWGLVVAGAAGSGAAIGTALFSKEEKRDMGSEFFDRVINQQVGVGEMKSIPLPPEEFKALPKELIEKVKVPQFWVGKTPWYVDDGKLHEPHRYFIYEEGGIGLPDKARALPPLPMESKK